MLRRLLLAASLLIGYTVSGSCLHGTTLLPRQYNEERHTVNVSNFSYTGVRGPLNWASLKPENAACASSMVQSPINIDDSIPLARDRPWVQISRVHAADFENLGSTLEVVITGTTVIGSKTFTAKQFHFHTPSEHRIDDEHYPLEMHLVHQAADGSGAIVVLAILFELTPDGSTTELLQAVIENIHKVAKPGSVTETGPLSFGELIWHLEASPLYQYSGSLTTPPCAEGVTFYVAKEPMRLDVSTYLALKKVMKFNSRYTQNTPGESNLLEVASSQVVAAKCGGITQPSSASAEPKSGVHGNLGDTQDACSGTSRLSCKYISH